MMKVVGLEHVGVVVLLEADGDGSILMLDKTIPQELDVLMKAKFADMLEIEDAIDFDDKSLA